jgi:hypothetical protein
MKFVALEPELASFFRALEAYCVVDCCGRNALDVSETMARGWSEKSNPEAIEAALLSLRKIKSIARDSSEDLEFITDSWTPQELVAWLTECEALLEKMKEGKI